MSHTQTKELNKITLGSMDFYVVEDEGTIPADNVIEVESNMIGRTKNGATVNYTTNWYVAESDDGKAKKRKLTGESATIGYGNITWNGNTLAKLMATARTTEDASKRTTKIGGVSNDNGKRYLIRGVYKDAIDGDVRITGVGVNTGGWEAVFAPAQETVINPTFELEPRMDEEGTLLIYEEEVIEAAVGVFLDKHTATVAVGSTVALTATTKPAGKTVTWSSDNTSEATVSDGTVTGAAAGTVKITASVTVNDSTYTDSCIVTVTAT